MTHEQKQNLIAGGLISVAIAAVFYLLSKKQTPQPSQDGVLGTVPLAASGTYNPSSGAQIPSLQLAGVPAVYTPPPIAIPAGIYPQIQQPASVPASYTYNQPVISTDPISNGENDGCGDCGNVPQATTLANLQASQTTASMISALQNIQSTGLNPGLPAPDGNNPTVPVGPSSYSGGSVQNTFLSGSSGTPGTSLVQIPSQSSGSTASPGTSLYPLPTAAAGAAPLDSSTASPGMAIATI